MENINDVTNKYDNNKQSTFDEKKLIIQIFEFCIYYRLVELSKIQLLILLTTKMKL